MYIEDDNKQKLYYHFTPSALTSNFSPLIVILTEKELPKAKDFEYKMWNILTIIPQSKNLNTELLQRLITQMTQILECEEHIYFYGDINKGYEALVEAIISKANAVYANLIHRENIEKLTKVINEADLFPIMYLCNKKSKSQDNQDLIRLCQKKSITLHQDLCPDSAFDEYENIKIVLDMFEHVT